MSTVRSEVAQPNVHHSGKFEQFLIQTIVKKIKHIILLVSILLSLICVQTKAQVRDLNEMELTKQVQQEKANVAEHLYVHVAKDFFIPGEIIWFKVYLVDSRVLMPSLISKVVYVELLDYSNKPITQIKIAIDSGRGSGSLVIPGFVSTGNYTFRAYTNLQKNETTPEHFFQSTISVFNPAKTTIATETKNNNKFHVSLLPEGGNIVYGLPATIAFKIQNQFGEGIDASGSLVDNENQIVTTLETRKFGIGRFRFTPKAGSSYNVKLNLPDGTIGSYPIKDIEEVGFSMQLDENPDQTLKISVNTNQQINKKVYLIVHNNKTVIQSIIANVKNGVALFTINPSLLPDGMNFFSVFNELKHPVSERLYFKKPSQQKLIDISIPKDQWSLREKVPMSIVKIDSSDKKTESFLSLATFLVDSLQPIPNRDIRTYFWLESHLRGKIEQAAFYLDSTDSHIKEITDNLILVHGWRKIVSQIPLEQNKTYTPEYAGHIVSGTLINKISNQPAAGILVYLSVPGERFHFSSCRSDAKGKIKFDLKKFFGTDNIIIQTNHSTDSIYRVELDNPFVEQYDSSFKVDLSVNSLSKYSLLNRSTAAQVELAFGENHPQQFVLPNYYDTSSFFGKPDITYLLDDYTRFVTMEEVLREYVTEIQVRKSESNFKLRILNQPARLFLEEKPLVLLDGVAIFDENRVISLDPLKIRRLDIVSRKYFQGGISFDGIASFNTYNGDLGGYALDPSSVIIDYAGLQLQRQFYSPIYDTESDSSSRIPDFRNILLWNPELRLKGNEKIVSHFYTSDLPGNYVMVIEGLSTNGKPFKTIKRLVITK